MKGMKFVGILAICLAPLSSATSFAQDAGLRALEKCESAMSPGGLGGMVQGGNTDLKSFCNAVRGLGDRVAALEEQAQSFSNAVIAFAVADPQNPDVDPCPAGWSLYKRANGRVIVGVSASDGPFQTGGAREHKLTIEEMPAHIHTIDMFNAPQHDGTGGRHPQGGDYRKEFLKPDLGRTQEAGKGRAHNNMPPYIALYFCKKEG